MKLAFLDMDGVFVTDRARTAEYVNYYGLNPNDKNLHELIINSISKKDIPIPPVSTRFFSPIDYEAVNNLYVLNRISKPEFVLISSWTQSETVEEMNKLLWTKGIRIKLRDAICVRGKREEETKKYIENTSDLDKFVIIDDEKGKYAEMYPKNFVYVNREIGYSKKDLIKSINILKGTYP